ncbi:hypothetical protein FisN_3Hh060 [Fistulifera solaris]|uniref:Globin family profile domain-containing protein n=1 Tax=Fistulifera solaris TaxID=1519565 RepID=A0A1Z5JNJ3_FISSO|nr:hypothetical protein FisN_3Hh060 [Fistulifera solaris]|eukprot:GAX15590.1 hypothetical protein FisN_3Hh060 [Fistulifera solaris]
MSTKSVHDLGTDVVRSVVEDLFRRFMNDEDLYPFFSNTRLSFLKIHSLSILKAAYAGSPSEEDLERIFKQHEYLFQEKGLDIVHFNKMVHHLEGVLTGNGVSSTVHEKAMKFLDELKPMFEKGVEYTVPVPVAPKKTKIYIKAIMKEPTTPTTSPRELSKSPNSLRGSFREKLIKSPSFMRRSIRIITKGVA